MPFDGIVLATLLDNLP